MSQTHTPTPWITHANDQIAAMVGDDLLTIAWALSASMGKELPARANAERIVLCCNAHDDLVAAAKAILEARRKGELHYAEVEFGRLRDALAKAGEK